MRERMNHAPALMTIRKALILAADREALDALDSIEREAFQDAPQQATTESPTLKRYTWTVRKTEARYFNHEALITIGGLEGEITLVVRPYWEFSTGKYTETLEQVIARYVGKTYRVTIAESGA